MGMAIAINYLVMVRSLGHFVDSDAHRWAGRPERHAMTGVSAWERMRIQRV